MKKTLTAAALLACTLAQAQTIAIAPNETGGEIRLMRDSGGCPEPFRTVVSTTPKGAFLTGCWTIVENDILVNYDDGQRRLYPGLLFTVVAKSAPAQRQQPRNAGGSL